MEKILILFLIFTAEAHAQNRFEVIKGRVDFSSNAALELIKASSEKIIGVIDPRTNQFAFIVNSGSFQGFNSELQRQHFNENYLETEKFYQSTFSGIITDSIDFFVDGVYKIRAKGSLLVHGKKKPREIPVTVTVSKGAINVQSEFQILLADHDITIPKIVNQKVATEIHVSLKCSMAEKRLVKK